MEKYYINYNTGAGNQTVEVEDLDEAKDIAVHAMGYTQMNIDIKDMDDNIVAVSRWYGVQATDEDHENGFVLEEFGKFGFYGTWEEQ